MLVWLRRERENTTWSMFYLDAVCPLFFAHDGISYKFLGEMYLHGFMNGESVEQSHQGSLKVEEFTLS